MSAQGETIDNIEAHVEAANAEVSKGSKNLSSAKKKQRSARKVGAPTENAKESNNYENFYQN